MLFNDVHLFFAQVSLFFVQFFKSGNVLVFACVFQRFPPFYLLHQKFRVHRHVCFAIQVIPVQFTQISRSFERIAQDMISVVCHGSPLDGSAFFRFGCRDETIWMNQILYFLVGFIQSLPVNGKLYRQLEKLEMILHKRPSRICFHIRMNR